MKIPNFVKVGGTTIAALILSACGSSGGDDSPSVKSSANTTPTTPVVPAPTAKEDQSVKAFNAAKAAEQAQESAVAANADAAKKEDLASAKDALKQVQAAQAAANSAAQAAAAAAAKAKAENAENAAMAADYAKRAADAVKALDVIAAGTQELVAKRMKQDDANKSVAVTSTPSNKGSSHVGYHHTQKVQSDLDLTLDGKPKLTSNESNTAVVMREQPIKAERDTLTVADFPDGEKVYKLYVQDLDLKKATNTTVFFPGRPSGATGNTQHTVTLTDAMVERVSNNHTTPNTNVRRPGETLINNTKTDLTGTASATALVYVDGAPIYIDIDSGIKRDTPVAIVNPDGTVFSTSQFRNHAIRQNGSSIQVYGARSTFSNVEGGTPQRYASLRNDQNISNLRRPEPANARNLPLVDGTLQYVQYGRVTSQLSGRELDAFLNGLDKSIKVAPYGRYGQPGTENHYFARGTNNTTAAQLAALPRFYGTSKMTFEGHANGYGIDNAYRNDKPYHVPSAVGGTVQPYLVSGNHIQANVDLTTKQVDGMVYNQWLLGRNGNPPAPTSRNDFETVKLVEFNGTLANNGNIAGTAVNLTKDNSPGIFNATIFGPNGEEMGGTIVSKEPEKVQWGLSFGAINTTQFENVVTPNPTTPKSRRTTDQQSSGKP